MLDKRRHRKRRLILENKILPQPKPYQNHFGRQTNIFNFNPFEPLHKDRFIVQLEDEHRELIIPADRIKGLNFFCDQNGERKIKIEAFIPVDDWLDDFLGVNICKIFLLDAFGNVLKFLDYDIVNSGHEYELKYSESSPLIPIIYYTVFD